MGSLLDRFQERLHRFARRRLGSEADALDAAQDTFLAALAGAGRAPEDPGAQGAWLFGIAAHKVADLLRRRYRKAAGPVPEEVAGPADPAGTAEARVEKARVLAALAAVPEPFREALVLATVDGLSYPEVAAAQGVPVGTVRSRIAAGRKALRAALGEGSHD